MTSANRYLNDFVDLTRVPALIVVAFSIGQLFDRWFWPCDLMRHFVLQYILIASVTFLTSSLARRWNLAFIFAVALVINIVTVAPVLSAHRRAVTEQVSELKIIQMNLNASNQNSAAFLQYVADCDADVLCIEEVNEKWFKYFRTALPNYRYWLANPREDSFGAAILSKMPLSKPTIRAFGSAGVPTLITHLSVGREEVTLICTHPLAPTSFENFSWRDQQLDLSAEFIASLRGPVILCGDLNTTPWSSIFQKFLGRSNLCNAASGFGLQPTWPTNCFLFWIPIDHVLVSPGIAVSDYKVGSKNGSDHFPVFVKLRI